MCFWVAFGTSMGFLWRPKLHPSELDVHSLENSEHVKRRGMVFICFLYNKVEGGPLCRLWFSRKNARRRSLGQFLLIMVLRPRTHTNVQDTEGIVGVGIKEQQANRSFQIFLSPSLCLLHSTFSQDRLGPFSLCIRIKKLVLFYFEFRQYW